MMVVTSPMGDHAPPLLADIIITPAYFHRSRLLLIKRRNIITIIIVVVILSRMADIKNDKKAITHIKLRLFCAVMRRVINAKPSYLSISSTIVIAPIKNTTISHVSPSASTSRYDKSWSCVPIEYVAQSKPHINSANTALLILSTCSEAIIR